MSGYKPNIKVDVVCLILVLTSCTVRLIAPYDEITDRRVFELQEHVSLTFKQWERDLPAYDEAEPFYDQVDIILELLIARNEAIEKSQQIVSMLSYVQENLTLIKEQHISGELTEEFVTEVYPDISDQFNAIQKFQMALKRAEDN